MRTRTPTIQGAIQRAQRDEDAHFATLLAAVFAFSIGFALSFVIAPSVAAGDARAAMGSPS